MTTVSFGKNLVGVQVLGNDDGTTWALSFQRLATPNGEPVPGKAMASLLFESKESVDTVISWLEAIKDHWGKADDPAKVPYGGTFKQGELCKEGSFYTDKGGLWYCKESTITRPGTSSAWQLSVKRGETPK